MSDELQLLIEQVVAKKDGNKEFALFYLPKDAPAWRAHVGNPYRSVMLGEINGEFEADGATATEAVARLLDILP